MIIKRTGNKVVDKMANISFRGDVVPSTWYSTFKDEKGKINAMALLMLANIVYWYRPTIIRDENGEVFIKRFKSNSFDNSSILSSGVGLLKNFIFSVPSAIYAPFLVISTYS